MSKIKGKIIFLPKNIKIYIKEYSLLFQSSSGNIILNIPKNITINKNGSFLTLKTTDALNIGGTVYQNIKNIINGLSRGYNFRLLLKGVGFRALAKNNLLEMKLGYSHLVFHSLNLQAQVDVYKNTIISLKSPLKDILGTEAAKIREKRKPDSYKGKGILYKGEKLTLKAGKKA
jgi:large subunit ribosomal protein L6